MVTLPSSPRPSSAASSIDIETNTDYLKMAKKGGGHKGWYWTRQHNWITSVGWVGIFSGAHIESRYHYYNWYYFLWRCFGTCSFFYGFIFCLVTNGSHLLLDLLTVDPHTPTSEPVRYDKTDGQWYGHDGVDVKETQQRKGKLFHLQL